MNFEPFYFGPRDQRLFAVYHPPSTRRSVPAGAVLCYPFLQEYFRSHRAFLRLAGQLAARGWHVLRFDYSGCGDSYGNGPRESDAWARDLQLAVRELRERAGPCRLALIGLRLGASLAASVAASVQPVDQLVLWDPVDGPNYIRELVNFRHAATLLPASLRKIERVGGDDRGVGLEVAPPLLESISRLGLAEQLKACADRILVLDTQTNHGTAGFAQRLAEIRRNVTFKSLSERPIWIEPKRNDPRNITVPTASLQAIVDWLTETGA